MSAETTCAAELKYLRSTAAIDLLCKGEELRKVRLRSLLLRDELDDANEKIFEEAERADQAECDARYWQETSGGYRNRIDEEEDKNRSLARELETLKAEILSLHTISADSKSLLTEKLSLSRDLASLKPELEHLRSQVSSFEKIFAEKLSLQQELSICRAELDNSKRSLERLQQQQGQSSEHHAQYESEIQVLKKDLAKEKREREKGERLAEKASSEQVDELREELAKERRDRGKAEDVAAGKKDESNQVADMKKELAAEKRDRAKAEKLAAKAAADWEAQKAVLDDKLDQFRSKLRSTKETLRETQTALEEAQQRAASGLSAPQPNNSRKRSVAQMDADATIGTPGDAAPSKRAKRASSMVGEKSNFSITPFLNRTTSLAPESPKDQIPGCDEPVASVEDTASPTAQRAKSASKTLVTSGQKAIPLGPASPGKSNTKVQPPVKVARKKAAAPLTLEIVAEEGDSGSPLDTVNLGNDENDQPTTTTDAVAVPTVSKESNANKPARLSLKPKKSLSSFATFREGSLPPQQLQKKKRKLLGRGEGPKTIFDEDEDVEAEADAPVAGKGTTSFGGQRAFGAFGGGRGLGALGLVGGAKKKGPLVVANDGFMFSPLKKDRKAMAAVAAAGGA